MQTSFKTQRAAKQAFYDAGYKHMSLICRDGDLRKVDHWLLSNGMEAYKIKQDGKVWIATIVQ